MGASGPPRPSDTHETGFLFAVSRAERAARPAPTHESQTEPECCPAARASRPAVGDPAVAAAASADGAQISASRGATVAGRCASGEPAGAASDVVGFSAVSRVRFSSGRLGSSVSRARRAVRAAARVRGARFAGCVRLSGVARSARAPDRVRATARVRAAVRPCAARRWRAAHRLRAAVRMALAAFAAFGPRVASDSGFAAGTAAPAAPRWG